MPANLSPDYHRAEERFRTARDTEDKIAALEEMLRVIPKHKGTEGMQGDLRARLAKLRKEPPKKGARGFSHAVTREGAGQVALVGPPNSGKSSLVAALTHATPEIGAYPFTTREPTPGMMAFEDVAIQLVDLPAVSEQHVEPWVFDLVRAADLLWIVLDITSAVDGLAEVQRLLQSHALPVAPVEPVGRSDHEGTRPKPALLVLTGADRPDAAEWLELTDSLLDRRWTKVVVSAPSGAGLDDLRERTFRAFNAIRIYTKQPGKAPDRSSPYVLPRGSTVGDLAAHIHKDLLGQMRFARVWGPSAFDGQTVHRDHVLADGDVVEIHA